ncbi:M14 family metallopeptidase [Pareuzebyella sediminis]|uniref:succinylglutamate desuccinylase/aspartoacylase domain-containing protein n=1 Tax=Pareuzebyella sediminis TaxID=2607998 RepID=UPI001E4EE718|nr:succinylglutamate desuccinylase/aspartoacylase family protein [Pareuzebyella sediminis]
MLETQKRIIGEYSSGKAGPILYISAGIHGNEPSGVYALDRVFKTLEDEKPLISGKVLGIRGNLKALSNDVRFIDEDLNRTWTVENIAAGMKDSNEKKEMFAIIDTLNSHSEGEFSQRYFLDCHTTSADSPPYISVQEVGNNDSWAHRFPVHIIRGFSDIVLGCIDHYLSRTGVTGFVFEGGQHESEAAVEHHEGMIWLAIAQACELDLTNLGEIPQAVQNLRGRESERKTFEIVHRHSLTANDTFQMEPGYQNFQPIKKGEFLATHNGEKVISTWNAYIFMPLYQTQGNDGFFVVREVPKIK